MARLPDDYLHYPWRRQGMDHDRYAWSVMRRRPALEWPGGARLAVSIVAPLTWYPLTMGPKPRPPQGAFDDPYPNLRDYTHRDYGNRVGAFRVIAALDEVGIRASAPINAAVCQRYPALVAEIVQRGWEVLGHGIDMSRQHDASLDEASEREMVRASLDTLRQATGQPVTGWLSPGHAESRHTPDLLREHAVEYVCDWVNDELPYKLRTRNGQLWAIPCSHEINDATVIWDRHHSPAEFADQAEQQFDFLYEEAGREGGRLFSLTVHAWCIGQPHRVHALERVLRHIRRRAGVWIGTGAEILDVARAQMPTDP